jgi:uncharacterized protein YaaW (UPF0174 family)
MKSEMGWSRRQALQAACLGVAALAPQILIAGESASLSMQHAAKFVTPRVNWSKEELNDFLHELPPEGLLSLKKALEMVDHKAGLDVLKGPNKDIDEILDKILWVSCNIFEWPFKDKNAIPYHELVQWLAKEAQVDPWIIETQSTFVVERAYQEKLVEAIWDKLNVDQRLELLKKLEESNPANQITDKAAIASFSGAGALAALSATVYLTSFAFYSTTSIVLCTAAGWFGVTLPFPVYTAASSTIAFLSGPVGWALLAVAAAAGIALAGRANLRKTAAAILQLHALKVAALQKSGEFKPEIFEALGDKFKRMLIGKWSLKTNEGWVDLTLVGDGTLTAEDRPDKQKTWREVDGYLHSTKGTWSARDGLLTVEATHVWLKVFWHEHAVHWIDNDRIKDITTSEVILAGGTRLVRR